MRDDWCDMLEYGNLGQKEIVELSGIPVWAWRAERIWIQ
jgi:hypothetical protein